MILYQTTGLVIAGNGQTADIPIPPGVWPVNLQAFATAFTGTPSLTLGFQIKDIYGHIYNVFAAAGGQILTGVGGFLVNPVINLAHASACRINWAFAGAASSITVDLALEG